MSDRSFELIAFGFVDISSRGGFGLVWFKYCKNDHHIETAQSLRLGGLHQYRKIESAELRDGEEGRFKFKIILNAVRTTSQWCEEVPLLGMIQGTASGRTIARNNDVTVSMDGDGLPGTVSTYSQDLNIKPEGFGSIIVDGRVVLKYESTNPLIFCVSGAQDNPFGDYETSWTLAPERILDFAQLVSEQVKDRLFELSYIHPINGRCKIERIAAKSDTHPIEIYNTNNPRDRVRVSQVGLNCRVSEVVYSMRELSITKASELSRKELLNWIVSAVFTKDERFSSEQELRFVFQPFIVSYAGHQAFLSFDLDYLDIGIDKDFRQDLLGMQMS